MITILTVQMRKLIRRGQVTASGCTNGKWWSQDANSLYQQPDVYFANNNNQKVRHPK